jgi:hypothetical protein
MAKSRSIAPPYSQIVIVDPRGKVDVPDWKEGALVLSTNTCIIVACFAEVDGETELTLGKMEEVDTGSEPAFEGKLKTPSRKIALETVEGDAILEARTNHEVTTVRIWANAAKQPDKVVVGIK